MNVLVEILRKQFKVKKGDKIKVPYINQKIGEKLIFEKILYLDDWSNLGVLKNNKNKLPSNKLKARLIIPDNYGQYGYLVYNNFENLLNWNRSNYFAIAVGKLSDNIKEN